jgi:pyridoxine 4-dehydrogenase
MGKAQLDLALAVAPESQSLHMPRIDSLPDGEVFQMMSSLSRRSFLGGATAAATTAMLARVAHAAAKRVRMRNPDLPAAASGTIWIGGDLQVSRIGLGTAEFSRLKVADDVAAVRAVLRRGYDLGVNFIDTADAYGDAEQFVHDALYPYPSDLVISTKGGKSAGADGSFPLDGRPEHLRAACEASLKRLALEQIPLYYLHEPDPKVRFEDSMGELGKLQKEGKIGHIGLSNVNAAQLATARSVVSVAAVQNQYNILTRESDDILAICEREHIVFVPYSPLGGRRTKALNTEDARLAGLQALAEKRHISLAEVVLAWLLARSPVMLPIPGTTRVDHVESDVAAAKARLTKEEMEQIG